MSLCPECGNRFGPLEAACPDCGVLLEREPVGATLAGAALAGAAPVGSWPGMSPGSAPGAPYAAGADLSQEPTTLVPVGTPAGPATARMTGPSMPGSPFPGPGLPTPPAPGPPEPGGYPNSSTLYTSGAQTAAPGGNGHVFRYTARQKDGQVVTGDVEAFTEQEALSRLHQQGLFVSAISSGSGRAGPGESRPGSGEQARGDSLWHAVFPSASLKARAFFFRQLASMTKAGINIAESFTLLQNQTANARLKEIAAEAAVHCGAGGKMSEVFRRHPHVFQETVIEMITAGEEAGKLERFLDQVADYMDREYQVTSRIKSALTYPAFMVLAVIFVPKAYVLVLEGFVPYVKATAGWALMVIGAVFGLLSLFRLLMANPAFAMSFDGMKLSLPVVGKVVRQYALGKFGRTLALLFSAGVPLSRGLDVAARACGNRTLAARLVTAVPAVQAGGLLSDAIARTGCFPPTAIHVIATGEKTGDVDQMVTKIAEFAEADANQAVDQAVVLILPICVILVGILVAVQVISFYTGYFGSMLNSAE